MVNWVLEADPGPLRDKRAHEAMQQHVPHDFYPHRCRCGDPYPCLTRFYARYHLILGGRLVLDRRPPRGSR